MSDTVETSPEEGTEEEQAAEETVEEIEEVEEEQQPEPQLTRAELLEILEKNDQRNYSRQGRREKELLDAFERKMSALKPPEPEQEFDFSNPNQSAEQIFDKVLTRRQQQAIDFQQSVINKAGMLIGNDEAFEDTEFGNEVIGHFPDILPKLNPKLDPADAAEVLLSKATMKVVKSRKSKKSTALDKNKPTNKKLGTVTAPSKSTKKSFDMSKLSDEARKFAKVSGATEEDLERLFGSG